MEIAPISGICALPTIKASSSSLRTIEVVEVDALARLGDQDTQRNSKKAAGAEENDETGPAPCDESESTLEPPEEEPVRQINYFA